MSNFNSSNSAIKDKTKPPENIQENTKIEIYEDQTKTTLEWFQPEKKNFSGVLWATVIIATLGVGFLGGQWWQSQSSETANKPSTVAPGRRRSTLVKAIPIETTSLQEISEFVGKLEAKRSVEVRPEIDGRVVEILAQEGTFISKGQAIAKLKSDNVEANLRRTKANLRRTQARLAELKTGARPEQIAASRARLNQSQARLAELNGARPEQIAASRARLNQSQASLAELQAGTRDEEIAQAKAQLQEAEARLANAKSGSLLEEIAQAKAQIELQQAELELASEQVKRNQNLRAEGAIAELTFQEIFKQEKAAKARVEEAKRRVTQLQRNRESTIETLEAAVEQQRQVLRRLENGTRPEEIARAQAEVAEARSNLEELQNGTRPEEIARAEAEVAEARSNLEELQNGTRPEEIAQANADVAAAQAEVESLEAELRDTVVVAPFAGIVGNMIVKMGDFVTDNDTITTVTANQVLEINLPIPLERRGDLKLGLPVEIKNSEEKPVGMGKVSFISPTVSSDSQTILVKADVDNSAGKLRDGQFVRVNVIWDRRQTVVVPMTAVGFQGEERFVYLLEGAGEEQKAKRQIIELGLVKGDVTEVVSGLQSGDKLIVSGVQKLKDGSAVKLLNSDKGKNKR
ncbi:efflux RND transporter periplasmic adaptor subunit [Okeania hirsuta]|uniref:Efflux RND transporter periplasmic adaptor subunit n=1 Tax=Okeania hirsuta TaxID=1458930 RepID=A0A3N6PEH4_9CYAN|nr:MULTISPECIES: efflux RND transporter periplasmic adaptor subunit [Okeania]NET75247.1 efflux RND transporter periplasmic adaptor subunit [Okeania sp. SIO1F9]RQH44755.1 efflux RND transporter periplasmic adaptor subunit [Okeania hirsuta]